MSGQCYISAYSVNFWTMHKRINKKVCSNTFYVELHQCVGQRWKSCCNISLRQKFITLSLYWTGYVLNSAFNKTFCAFIHSESFTDKRHYPSMNVKENYRHYQTLLAAILEMWTLMCWHTEFGFLVDYFFCPSSMQPLVQMIE